MSHTNVILTADFLLLTICQDSVQSWARDAAAVKQQGMHAFSLHYSAHLKPFCPLFSLQSVKKKRKKKNNRRLCYFSPPNQTNRVRFWQETAAKTKRFSCLDQQGKKEKDTQRGEKKGKKITRPHPWEQENIKNIQLKVQTQRLGVVFKRALGHKLHRNAEMVQVGKAVLFVWLAAA